MYTSGWPKSQNRCCQSSASPPRVGSKKAMPKARSASSRIEARISGGKATSIISAVTRMYQPKIGIRSSDIPGARIFSVETTISTAKLKAEISTKVTPSSHTSALTPGV